MQETIIKGLQSWRNSSPPPDPLSVESEPLRQAMIDQDLIGWNNMINGFFSKQWRLIQTTHLREIGSRKSPILWISRFQKRIWLILWSMWQHRNDYLHNDGTTIHFQETVAINNEIRAEYEIRGGDLPVSYLYLFQHLLGTFLQNSIFSRREWLASVWATRDHHTPEHGRIRNAVADAFYIRWKKQFK